MPFFSSMHWSKGIWPFLSRNLTKALNSLILPLAGTISAAQPRGCTPVSEPPTALLRRNPRKPEVTFSADPHASRIGWRVETHSCLSRAISSGEGVFGMPNLAAVVERVNSERTKLRDRRISIMVYWLTGRLDQLFLVTLVFLYRLGRDGRSRFDGIVLLNVSCVGSDGTPSLATTDADCYGRYDKQ